MAEKLPHEIATIVGRTGSGKTALIANHLGPRHQRRITIDLMGEGRELYPRAHHAVGLGRVLNALDVWTARELETWHVVAVLETEEIAQLIDALCPIYDGTTRGLSAALGGVCLEIFEIDVLAPVNGSGGNVGRALKNAYARGRHVGLSILGATQRPHQCDRMITAQSHYVISFSMHEPNDTKWLRDVGGAQFALIARQQLAKYSSVWYCAEDGALLIYGADYTLQQRIEAGDNAGGDMR